MGGLIHEVKIPVQELGGQRREGAYFRENMVVVVGHTPLNFNVNAIFGGPNKHASGQVLQLLYYITQE